jgi:hypothetical protein
MFLVKPIFFKYCYYYRHYYYFKIHSCLSVTRWRSYGKSRSQQEIKAVAPSTDRMCTVLISVIFCSPMAEGWPGSNWRFWSHPFLIVPDAPITTGTIFVLIFHILLNSISSSIELLSFSVSFVLAFLSFGVAISISRELFSCLSCSVISGRFA